MIPLNEIEAIIKGVENEYNNKKDNINKKLKKINAIIVENDRWEEESIDGTRVELKKLLLDIDRIVNT